MRLLTSDDVAHVLAATDVVSPDVSADLLVHPACGPPLRVYLALSDGRLGGELTPLDRLYNRYFWFSQFASAYRATFGFDAGVEQQMQLVLEYADCDVDWNVIQQIEATVRSSH
jgi:hypothetical protein